MFAFLLGVAFTVVASFTFFPFATYTVFLFPERLLATETDLILTFFFAASADGALLKMPVNSIANAMSRAAILFPLFILFPPC